MFVLLLRVCLVCGLALLGYTVPLPLLDCLSSTPRLPGAVGPRAACPSLPRPWPPLVLPVHPARLLPRVCIWSMKEFCNLNCNAQDVFKEFFRWPNELSPKCGSVWKANFEFESFYQLPTSSSTIGCEWLCLFVLDIFEVPSFDLGPLDDYRCWLSLKQRYHYFKMFQFTFWADHCVTIYL